MEIEILKKTDIDKTMQHQISQLYTQLNADIRQRPLHQILQEDNHVTVAACKIDKKIVGIALLATYKVISGHRGIVEDVVVDSEYRQKGIGRQLMEKLLVEARHQSLDGILLFSGHHRKPAIRLYQSLGFSMRESGVYTLKLT